MGKSQSQAWLEGVAWKGVSPGRAKRRAHGYQVRQEGDPCLAGEPQFQPCRASDTSKHLRNLLQKRWMFSAADLVTEWPSHY